MGTISISKSDSRDPKRHVHFKTREVRSFEQMKIVLLSCIWSPILWRGGVRHSSNFVSAQYLGLDFDDGRYSLCDAETWCESQKLNAIIGTTKSHQKEKVKPSGKKEPAVDRFRIVIPFSKPIVSYGMYRAVMEHIFKDIPTDKSCKDGARYFWPCTAIHREIRGGNSFLVPEVQPAHTVDKAVQKERMGEVRGNPLAMPSWISRTLAFGAPEGKRNVTVFRIAANLALAGFREREIIAAIKTNPQLASLGDSEIEQAVRNGIQAAET